MIEYHKDSIIGTPEWHKLWTGSKAVRLLSGKPLPPPSSDYQSAAMRRGHILEKLAIEEYEREYKRCVATPGFVTNTVYPNAGYSPDGIDGGWLLEVKSFNGERHEALVGGDIPLSVLSQIYFGMIITGRRKARLLAYNPEYEQHLTVIDIAYDKMIGANIRKKLRTDIKKRQLSFQPA